MVLSAAFLWGSTVSQVCMDAVAMGGESRRRLSLDETELLLLLLLLLLQDLLRERAMLVEVTLP